MNMLATILDSRTIICVLLNKQYRRTFPIDTNLHFPNIASISVPHPSYGFIGHLGSTHTRRHSS